VPKNKNLKNEMNCEIILFVAIISATCLFFHNLNTSRRMLVSLEYIFPLENANFQFPGKKVANTSTKHLPKLIFVFTIISIQY
jgi:hypothetical protein